MATAFTPLRTAWTSERKFFLGLSVAFLLTTLIGFAPTYYLVTVLHGTTTRGVADGASLTAQVHMHGLTGTAWMVLLVTQAGLISADRRDLHMRVGQLVLPVGLLLAVTAYLVAIDAARRGATPPGWTPPQFLLIQFGSLAGFAVFAALAMMWRKRSDWHKRAIMLATYAMMVPVCGRIWVMLGGREFARGTIGGMLISNLFLIALAAYDLRSRKRLHPVTVWGGGALLLAQPLRVWASGTEGWLAIGRWFIGAG